MSHFAPFYSGFFLSYRNLSFKIEYFILLLFHEPKLFKQDEIMKQRLVTNIDCYQGVPLCVVRPCLHDAVSHCQIQNNFVIRSKNGEAIIQCGNIKYRFSSDSGHSVGFLN